MDIYSLVVWRANSLEPGANDTQQLLHGHERRKLSVAKWRKIALSFVNACGLLCVLHVLSIFVFCEHLVDCMGRVKALYRHK